jgi:tetratricopeptide (TPR) repeat protein
MLLLFLHGIDAFDERQQLADDLLKRPREGVSARALASGLWSSAPVLLAHGDRPRAEECWRQISEIATRTHDAGVLLFPLQATILRATLDGAFDEALAALQELGKRAEELGAVSAAQRHFFAVPLCAYLEQEDLASIIQRGEGRVGASAGKALCLAHLGRQAEAREALQQSIRQAALAEPVRIDYQAIWLETAVLLRDRELVAKILPQLSAAAHLLSGQYWHQTCVARHLGAGASLRGDMDSARAYTEQAIEVASRVRHRPEIALSRLQLAEVLLDGSDEERAQAAAHLDAAIDELRAMKMQPALERALRHKGLLHA